MLWAKQSTAATVTVGPILDVAGVEYTGAVIGDLTIRKHDGSGAALAAAATLTHVDNGYYTLVLTTGNTDTVGRVQVRVNKATYQCPPLELMVLPATVYDALVTNAVNTTGGLAAATGVINALAGSISTFAGGAVDSVTGSVGSVAAGGITAASIATGAIDADAVAADAVTEIQSGLATAAALATVAGYLDTEIAAILEDTGTTLPAQIAALNDLSAAQVTAAVPTAAQNATAVLTTALTEGYAADGAAFTASQALYMLWAILSERSIAGTTLTAKNLAGTAAMTFTLDSAGSPTSQTRAT